MFTFFKKYYIIETIKFNITNMKKLPIVLLFVFIITVVIMIGYNTVLAETQPQTTSDPKTCTGPGCKLDNPLTGVENPQQLIGKVIIAALGIVGSIALLMFIYGGFVWMTAAGNQEMVTRGRNILMWAAIGLIVIFSSYALVKFVFQGIGAMS